MRVFGGVRGRGLVVADVGQRVVLGTALGAPLMPINALLSRIPLSTPITLECSIRLMRQRVLSETVFLAKRFVTILTLVRSDGHQIDRHSILQRFSIRC